MSPPKKFNLKRDHGWKAKAGYAICVLDRGAVRFEFPRKWVLKQQPDSVQVHDSEPPDNNCVLDISRFLPPAESNGVPVRELVASIAASDERRILERKGPIESQSGDVEVAWVEMRYADPQTRREAFSRIAIARGLGVHCLITYDFWADQATRFAPVWDEVLRSLVLGKYVEDSAAGPRVQ